MLAVSEDTPPDMLAGAMDLRVVLPGGNSVKMSVARSTPMMDLLVQVTTLNKLSPASHVLQAIGERGLLPYKPSTPIGALDTWTIHVVSKNKVAPVSIQKKAPLKPANQQQPFEQTFRLQVHLPRNQLYVMRVSPRTRLSDILQQTCSEKNLDASKYEMRNPANLSELLSPSCTLADYGLQEVTVVARSSRAPGMGAALSSSDIMALQREEEKRRQQARQQPGLSLVFNKRSRSSVCEGSVSSDSLGGRSISPARSDESASRSASPPAPSLPPMMNPPARPARKRRPAPKPPGTPDGPSTKQNTQDAAVSHSRNSSDSSGYHEASVLSDSPAEAQQMPDTLPRRGKVSARSTNPGGLSRSMSSLTSCQHSTSNTSLASSTGHGQKKKKAPPPPPGIAPTKDDHLNKTTSLERHLSGKSTNQPHDKCSTLPGKMKMSQHEYARKTPSPEMNIPEESRVPLLSEEPRRTSVVKERKTPSPEMQVIEEVRVPSPVDLQERRVSEESIDVATTRNDANETRIPQSADVLVQKKAPSPVPQVVDESKVPLASIQQESVISETKPPSPETRLSEEVRLPSPTDVQFQRMSEKSETVRKPELPIANLPPSSIHSTEVKLPPPKQPENRLEEPYLPPAPVETAPEPPIDFAVASDSNASDTEDAVDQVEEAFRSVTAELEAVIKQEEDLNILPPPPLPEDDPAVDWEYQLPAPPSAFRDADSPTLTEGETVVLADTQVFKEPENMDVHLNQAVYRNEVTRVNPLFISQEYDDNPPSKKMELSRTRQISNGEIQHNKQQNESNNRHSRRLYDEDNSREIVAQLKEQQHSVVASRDVKQFNNEIHLRKEQNNETNRNNVEVRVREEPKQYNGLSARSNELSNFTLTTYQRPRLMSDEIFNEGSDEEKQNSLQKSTKLYLHQKFGSTSAINNTSANLSRTNSFNEEEVKPPASVKRSTSYISLIANPVVRTGRSNIVPNRTKSVGNLATEDQAEKTEEQKELQNLQEQFLQLQKQLVQNPELLQSQAPADAPLQSLQVLRSILPQLNQQQNRTTVPPKSLDEELFKQPAAPAMKPSESKPIKDSTNSDKQTSVVTVNNEKRYAYRGPPAVNFTTWSERPKSQVSIKMDGDYRIGVGQGGISEQKDKPAELVKEVATSKPSPAPLTMHLVSHSAAPTVRKPTATVVQKFEEVKAKEPKVASTVGFRTPQHSDPSRVPIVRAVELKKSFIQQQNLHKSTTVLNGDSHVDQRNGEDETFAGVNSLAKRFSFAAPSSNSSRPTRPVSSYSKVENQASSMGIKSVSSTNLNVNTNNDTKSRRYTSVVGIGSDSDHSLSSTSFREPRGPSVVRVNGFAAPKQLMPVVKGFQFAAPAANRDNQPQRSDSMSGIRPRKIEQNHSEESKPEPPPPPPLAASMRKSTARPRPKTLPAAMPNPRDQLMDAIRNFGGREKLRQVCRTQDNVVLIR